MDDAGFLIRHAVLQDAEDTRRVLVETWHDTYDPLLGSEKVTEITDRWHAVDVLTQQIGSSDDFSWWPDTRTGSSGTLSPGMRNQGCCFCPAFTCCRLGSGAA